MAGRAMTGQAFFVLTALADGPRHGYAIVREVAGYCRGAWEEDMAAAFLDGWLTGDPDEDSVTMEYDRPSRAEIASVAVLAARLYLGGVVAPRRYFAWGQAAISCRWSAPRRLARYPQCRSDLRQG